MNLKDKPMVTMAAMLVASHLLALFMVLPFQQLGYNQSFDNPDDPTPLLFYVLFMLVFTALLLLLFKYKRGESLKYFLYFAFGMIIYNVLYVPYVYMFYYAMGIPAAGAVLAATVASLVTAVVVMFFYAVLKDWRLTNSVGVLVSAGAIGIFGVNFSILPVMIFLIVLAVYDYIAVHRTKHMLTLADGVLSLGVPMMLTVPKKGHKLKPDHRPKVSIKESVDAGKKVEREAMYMGLGDLIIPGILVVSALAFLPFHPEIGVWGARLVALGTMFGVVLGYMVLAVVLAKGNPQPGLPFLNTGAIVGYILFYLMIYKDLTLGMSFSW